LLFELGAGVCISWWFVIVVNILRAQTIAENASAVGWCVVVVVHMILDDEQIVGTLMLKTML